jgi:pyruvate/2-oxoglutarate dehydrogenase complex dihydrolipoamide dehydrogenase (E3) component
MSRHDYDIVSVGGGAAGLVTAAGAAALGARVALVERERLGGECLWSGCVPSKALLTAARSAAMARSARRFGVAAVDVSVAFEDVMEWLRSTQQAIAPHDSPDRFRALGVDVFEATARFTDEGVLDVAGAPLRARHVVIATGSRPVLPPIAGLHDVPYHTNETIFSLERLPARLLVIGAGAVGLELAQAFARLGSRVTIIEAAEHMLPREEPELAAALGTALRADGVAIRLATTVRNAEYAEDGIALHVADAGGRHDLLHGDALLVAAGRRANLAHLAAAAGGVAADDEGVRVDATLHTTARRTWAAGDVVAGAPRFTHVADYHARLVLRNAFFPWSRRVDYAAIPWVTYTDPELAHLGLTEREARGRHGRVEVVAREFAGLDRAVVSGATTGVLKVIADRRGRILGAHALGAEAGSIIGEIGLAMKNGVRLPAVAATVHAYPTWGEAFRQAADAFNRTRLHGWRSRLVRRLVRR